ncbi:MAG: insulinase family protein [Tindallia sp. MSAO_Bac2]|nr:MAG: insulinase family protein [Tindallia sp. MSAO_Bac2]
MELQKNEKYYGFLLQEKREMKDINGTGYLFLHEKSGAKLFYLSTRDDNKVFSVSFRTPPLDSSGLPHILEHSVLCGSKKYPLKDPFVELAKGSMNTFLNAMTFSDKTMYPVASRNQQDFLNLMDVYLDSVFYPNIYRYPEILQQEGWHYVWDEDKGQLSIKGVVFNEMKGAFSSPEQMLFRKTQESLFPDNPYGNESGGDPNHIPELTQDKFLKYHQEYYHPSNAYFYIYGDGDILNHLEYIDEEYLSKFTAIDIDSAICWQNAFEEPVEQSIKYPVSSEENTEDKTYLSLNFVAGDSRNPELHLSMDMLNHLLLGTSAAPLKKKLIQSEIGKDVFGYYDSSIQQPVFGIVVKNSNEESVNQFAEIVFETLQEVVENGFDKKLIESVINSFEFKLREADFGRYPKGLMYGMKMMESWLYDADPYLHLEFTPVLKKIKKSLEEPYFENLIQKYLMNNTHRSLIKVIPEPGLNEAKEEAFAREMEELRDRMTGKEKESLIRNNERLLNWQNEKATKEEIETIPLLSIDDLDPEPEQIPIELSNLGQVPVLRHPLFTNNIVYTNLYFDLKHLDSDQMPAAGLLVSMMGKLSTDQHHYEDLSNEINLHTGGIGFSLEGFPQNGDSMEYEPKLQIKARALTSKNHEMWRLIEEISQGTKWTEKKRMREVIREIKSRLEMSMLQEGHLVSVKRALSYLSPASQFLEATSGIQFYHYIADLDENFEEQFETFVETLKEIHGKIFHINNLTASFTADEKDLDELQKPLLGFFDSLHQNELEEVLKNFRSTNPWKNEGLYLSSDVQYVAKAGNLLQSGYNYAGSLQVLKTIISLDYLWKKIRVTGGAYGAMSGFQRNGNMFFVSYRDPNLEETLKVYDGLASYVSNFSVDDREMTKYIIGTLSRMDTPLTPAMKSEKADGYYFSAVSQEDLVKERQEILSTTPETITTLAEMITESMKDEYICVLGNENRIKNAQGIFQRLIPVLR